MSDMESLEDMLAALERPGGGARRPVEREDSVLPQYNEINDIDEFLDDLEEETRRSSARPAPKRQSFSVAPQAASAAQSARPSTAAAAHDSYENLSSQQRDQVEEYDDYDEAKAHEEHANENWFDPSQAPEYSDLGEAADAFRKSGYSEHYNKGKFINYEGGEATDFRIKGTTSTRVGLIHAITLRSLDDYGEPASIKGPKDFIGCVLTHRQTNADLRVWYRDNGDSTYDLAFFAEKAGTVRMEIKLCGNPMFDIDIQVEAAGQSQWVAQPNLPARAGEPFVIDIVTIDGSRPDGVAPFEVQSMGDLENLKLFNNGDGTYKFTCVPQGNGFITVQISLHGQPIKSSPVTVQVGEKKEFRVKQQSRGVESKDIDAPRRPMPAQSTPMPAPLQAKTVSVPASSGTRPSVVATPAAAAPPRSSYARPDPAYAPPPSNDDLEGFEEYAEGEDQEYADEYYDDYQYEPRQSAPVSNDDLNALLDELGG